MNIDLPFTITGTTVRGKRLGTELGFPTANLTYPPDTDLPPNGVYVACATLDGQPYAAILNQGSHPTAPQGQATIESHLLGYEGGDLYGRQLELRYLARLRDERRFDTLDALKAQLRADEENALAWIAQNDPMLAGNRDIAGSARRRRAVKAADGSPDKGDEMTQQPPIETRAVAYRYEEDGQQAVDHVTLSIPAGTFVAVLGHNGSGKSTLAKLMNALYLPTEGSVWVCGLDTAAEEHLWDVRKHAGMVFQNPDNQIVATVVREDVAFGLENLGVPQTEMLPRIEDALAAVRMTDYAAAAPHMLSGGQKQRVAVAGVLAMQPDVMILDEATAMLDPSGREEVFSTVRKLNRDKGITVVWITHFMEEAALADRVVVLHQGAVAMDGTPREVFSRVDEVKALGLDVPPMAELASMLTLGGLPLPPGILTVEDMTKELTAWRSASNT